MTHPIIYALLEVYFLLGGVCLLTLLPELSDKETELTSLEVFGMGLLIILAWIIPLTAGDFTSNED